VTLPGAGSCRGAPGHRWAKASTGHSNIAGPPGVMTTAPGDGWQDRTDRPAPPRLPARTWASRPLLLNPTRAAPQMTVGHRRRGILRSMDGLPHLPGGDLR
jgi:hypothetical protein